MSYKTFFGFQKEPFSQEIRVEELYPLPGLKAASERFMYAMELGAVSIVTGDVGSSKSTTLRYAASKLHPSRYKVVSLVGSTGSIINIMRLLCAGFDAECYSNSLTKLTRILRAAIVETAQRKQVPGLIMDGASLLRIKVCAHLHILSQFEMDSRPLMPMVLAGQNNLIDNHVPYVEASCLQGHRQEPHGGAQGHGRIHQASP